MYTCTVESEAMKKGGGLTLQKKEGGGAKSPPAPSFDAYDVVDSKQASLPDPYSCPSLSRCA